MPGVTRPEAGGQGDVLPTLGGASRAFGLPPAAAKRLLRAEARTHFCPGALRRAQARSSPAGEHPCDGRAGPVCRFRREGGGGAPKAGISTALSRVWGGTTRTIQIQRKNASGSPVLGPLGAFDFSTRIKDRGGKPPPARPQRPAVRGVPRDCGLGLHRKLRWSLRAGWTSLGGRWFGEIQCSQPVPAVLPPLPDCFAWDWPTRQGAQILRRYKQG